VPSTSGRNLRVISAGSEQPKGKRLPLRVLIADDDRDTAMTLAMVLRDEGHEVHTTLRGDEVLDSCRLLRPDVVIIDINMPGMSGYAVARELRERHGTLAPLMIAISGVWTRSSDRLVGTAVGFDHYLLKPCEPKEVLRLIEPLRSGDADAGSAA
jgi:two-component system, OmpR family, response regulator